MAKILLVDDSALSRRIMRGILEPQGHQIIEASNGLAGIETYLLERPDLVMLDMLMTGLQGNEVLEKLRELDTSARVIIATADLQEWTRKMVEESGANGFINKPFVGARVLEVVNSVLEGVPK